MSRCFPYPPPGYVRNPVVAVAAAEAQATTKLQKVREKAEKKKEKKSDRKALPQGEISKHSKRTHKKRKHEEINVADQKSQKSSSLEPVEQLEKSGLSEEHGVPCFTQTVHGSPESSQDSSKRRKFVLPSPSQAKNGNILRIKIRRDQDSSASLSEKSNVVQTPVHRMGSVSSLLSKKNSMQPHNTEVVARTTSTQQQSIKGDLQAVPEQGIPTPGEVIQRVDVPPSSMRVSKERFALRPAEMLANVGPSPSKAKQIVHPAPAKVTQRVDAPPAKASQRIDPVLPSKVQIAATRSFTKVSQTETKLEVHPLPPIPKVPVAMPTINCQHINTSQPKEEPCSSGRNAEAASVLVEKKSKSDRKKSRKAEKKEKKFKDLFVTWDPPSIEMDDMNLGDQDWLLVSTRKPDAGIGNCREIADPLTSQSAEQYSLQPRAIHLPDLHVYQLPYVVPF